MALNGITDTFTTVSVPKSEYEELVRDSETLQIVRDYVGKVQYINDATLKILLDIEEKSKESEGTENGI